MAEEVIIKFKADLDEIKQQMQQLKATASNDTAINPIDKNAVKDTQELTKKVEELATSTEEAANSVENYKKRLTQIKRELATLDENSDKFKKLSKEAGILQDKINDVSARVRVFASDTKRLDASIQAVQGIAGAFSAVQGATALFGAENEELNKSIQKVQGSLALLNGVQAVAQVLNKDSAFSVLFLSKAQAILNAVMAANPIFLVVAALTALIGGIALAANKYKLLGKVIDFVKEIVLGLVEAFLFQFKVVMYAFNAVSDYFSSLFSSADELERRQQAAAEAEKKRQKEIDIRAQKNQQRATEEIKNIEKIEKERIKAHEREIKAIDFEIEKRRAAGKETADLEAKKLKMVIDRAKEELAAEEAKNNRLKQLLEEQAAIFGVSQEAIKQAAKNRGLDVDAIEKNRLKAVEEASERVEEAERKLTLFRIEQAKKASDKLAEGNKKLQEINIELEEDERTKRLLLLDAKFKEEFDKYKNRNDILLALQKQYERERLKIDEELDAKEKERQEKKDKEREERLRKEFDEIQESERKKEALLDAIAKSERERLEKELNAKLELIDKEKQIYDARIALAQQFSDIIANLSTIAIEDSEQLAEFQKALAAFNIGLQLAQSLGNVITGAAQAAAATGALAPFTLAGYIASGVAAVTAAFAQAKQLLSQTPPKFAKGVEYLHGSGTETSDSIPALLSRGERVVTAEKNKKYWDELHAIHTGTFENLLLNKYLLPFIAQKKEWHGDNIVGAIAMSNNESRKHHKQLIKVLNKRERYSPRRW